MDVKTDRSKPYVVFSSAKALKEAKLVPFHSLGGLKREDPKFTFRVEVPGHRDALTFLVDPVRAMSVQTPANQPPEAQYPNSWEAPISSLVCPPGEPTWADAIDKWDKEALRLCTSFESGTYLAKEARGWKNVPIPCLAEHYVRRTFKDLYDGVVEKKVGSKPLPEWTDEEKAAVSEELAKRLTEPDDEGKTKFKPSLSKNGGMYVGLRNYKNGGPTKDNNGGALIQTDIRLIEGGTEVSRTPEEFIADATYGDGTKNQTSTVIQMDMMLEQKHIFFTKGKNITSSWHIDSVSYTKPSTGGNSRRRSVLACEDAHASPPSSPAKKPKLEQAGSPARNPPIIEDEEEGGISD